MAEKRKPIGKKLRFEVFKRDSFTCQYCGRSSPDVILEVDHIKPVAEGGKNTLLNLVTSCRDCNRGKGKLKLDDKTEVVKQRTALEDLNEKRLQMEMMLQWKEDLEAVVFKQVAMIEKHLTNDYKMYMTDSHLQRVKNLIKEFGFDIVYDACDIAVEQYYFVVDRVQKLGGICYNLKRKRAEDGN